MIETTPTRFIAINSGKFDYAEIAMNKNVELVGENNMGKTSLIVGLQFFLLDDEKKMRFSKDDIKKTKEYYFPSPYSYMVLEIQTPQGYFTMVARGLGQLQGSNFERLIYRGTYSKEDFVNQDGTVFSWEEIQRRIMDSTDQKADITTLKPSNMKAVLTGAGIDNRGYSLNLIPLRHEDDYKKFKFIFTNLLHLNDVNQDQLKTLLVAVYRKSLSIIEPKFDDAYTFRFREFKGDDQKIRNLSKVAGTVLKLADAIKLKRENEQRLKSLFLCIDENHAKITEAARSSIKDRADLIIRKKEESELCFPDWQTIDADISDLSQAVGKIKGRLEEFDKQTARFSKFDPDLPEQELKGLQQELRTIQNTIDQAKSDTPGTIRKRISHLEKEIATDRNRLTLQKELFAIFVKKHFSDSEIAQIFKVLNHQILGLVVGDTEIAIDNEKALLARLKQILQNIDEHNFYNDAAISIQLDKINPPDLSQYCDPEKISENIRKNVAELEKQKTLLNAALDMEQTKNKAEEIARQVDEKQTLLTDYKRFIESKSAIPAVEAECKNAAQKLSDRILEKTQKTEKRAALEKEIWVLLEKNKEENNSLNSLLFQIKEVTSLMLATPDIEIDSAEADRIKKEFNGFALKDLIDKFKSIHHAIYMARPPIMDMKDEINKATNNDFNVFDDEVLYIAKLVSEVDNLEENKKKNDEAWKNLVVGLTDTFKGLMDSLDSLTQKIRALNHEISSVSISDIEKLELKLEENVQLCRPIRELTNERNSPLLSYTDHVDDSAMTTFSEMLKRYESIKIEDLFSLKFMVKLFNTDKTTVYHDFSEIESKGTNISIKILINMILLKSLFDKKKAKDCSIPYYIDEINMLSRNNQDSIIATSKALNFNPIMAGTKSIDGAEIVYYLCQARNNDGSQRTSSKVNMRPEYRIDIARKEVQHAA